MSFVDHTQSIKVPYSEDDTFLALKSAIKKVKGFKVERFDSTMKTVYAKTGMSTFSWGENITVSVRNCPDGTAEVLVLSTPKTGALFGGATDMGKNRKNIMAISLALSKELGRYQQVEKLERDEREETDSTLVADEIKKLANLKEQGILSEEEFAQKKKQLLNL